MFHIQQAIPDFATVTAGKTATTNLPTGLTYREITLRYVQNGIKATRAKMISDIEKVTLTINGVPRWEISGANLLMLNDYYGFDFNDGELVLPLSRHYVRSLDSEEFLCWGTRNVSNFGLKVKIASGATSPELNAEADYSFIERDLGQIIEIHEFNYEAQGTGVKEISDLPKEQGALMAMHINNADVQGLEIKADRLEFIERDTDLTVYQNRLKRIAGRAPQTGVVHFDAMRLNRLADVIALQGVQDFRVKPDMSAAGTLPIIMETLNSPLTASRP